MRIGVCIVRSDRQLKVSLPLFYLSILFIFFLSFASLTLIVLILLYPPLFSLPLYFPHPFGLSHTHCLPLSHPTFSHLLTFFYIFRSPFFLSAHSPSSGCSSAPITPLKHSISSLLPICSTTLQPFPIICVFFPIFFLFLRGPFGFQSALSAISLI